MKSPFFPILPVPNELELFATISLPLANDGDQVEFVVFELRAELLRLENDGFGASDAQMHDLEAKEDYVNIIETSPIEKS